MATSVSTYLRKVTTRIESLKQLPFDSVLKEIERVSQEKRTIFLLGNGASSTTASHFTNDLTKNASKRTNSLGFGIKAISLSDNMPFFTAVSNDASLNEVYSGYLRNHALPGDLLVIFTSEIPHRNIIEAAKFAYARGLRVVSVTGKNSGILAETSHAVYEVEDDSPECIEDVHMFLCHSWVTVLRERLTQPVVFLDRDGVINENRSDYVKKWEEFEFLPEVGEAVRKLNNAGYAVVVVTNQSAVGRGFMSCDTLSEIHSNMYNELYSQGAIISKIYCCTHAPCEKCNCRKPSPGLIERAFKELPLDMKKSIIIGDNSCDIEAGQRLNITTVLLRNGNEPRDICEIRPDYQAENLISAVNLILSKNFRYNSENLQGG